jgi:hypothetical protein
MRIGRSFLVASLTLIASAAMAKDGGGDDHGGRPQPAPRCQLANGVQHVVYIQFDNTHLLRDKAEVPSDLEQMPHLLNFMRGYGTVLNNDHTVLISHTAGGILSTLTGVYPDRHGQTVTNSYVRTSAAGAFSFPSAFTYWTDPVSGTIPNMINENGVVPPAPWVPFTRAGCDVGASGAANIVLENTGTTATGDVTKVFGAGSTQFAEANASAAAPAGSAARNLAQTDFVGFAVHCAKGSALCANGHPDLLPDEPQGYTGFNGLFGAKEINPQLTGGPVVHDLFGAAIADPFGQPGFPGFDGMEATVSLAYVAAMHERGVQVTFAYVSDAHDFHGVSGNAHDAFGPGSSGYVAQLKAYDQAFDLFFQRMARAGFNKSNTLFIFTVDEGDHFVGGAPTPATCDGVNTPCDWTNQIGEVNANIDTLVTHQFPALAAQFLGTTAPNTFTVHGDDAPTFYLATKNKGAMTQTDPLVRNFERSVANLTAANPYTGNTDRLLAQMADQTGMKALHMMTPDAGRNATFVYFADPNYFITDFPTTTCETCIQAPFAWNHGDIQPEIRHTWIGLAGPGVRNLGETDVWTDHTDVRPTVLQLTGLHDTYESDGRVITEVVDDHVLSDALKHHEEDVQELGAVYKQLNAPFGLFNRAILTVSTHALEGSDMTYTTLEAQIVSLTAARESLAADIRSALNRAAFDGVRISDDSLRDWTKQADALISQAIDLAL